ncbi:unnamed protein product [Penicillium camemberti]|uniref:Str. FM013 n=1 Tax=Penicillium camemberti (strain FM 013) TaxID=1429867 RepID=A0A0G4P3L4_PENC3|nr:unnamed protein product [Penicillium camemberti]
MISGKIMTSRSDPSQKTVGESYIGYIKILSIGLTCRSVRSFPEIDSATLQTNGQKQLGFLESRASSGMFLFQSDLQPPSEKAIFAGRTSSLPGYTYGNARSFSEVDSAALQSNGRK